MEIIHLAEIRVKATICKHLKMQFGGRILEAGGFAFHDVKEASDCIETVEIITTGGQTQVLGKPELDFSYRSSPFQGMKDLASITAVTFKLKFSQEARQKQMEYLERYDLYNAMYIYRIKLK